jgi:hypothetical protein
MSGTKKVILGSAVHCTDREVHTTPALHIWTHYTSFTGTARQDGGPMGIRIGMGRDSQEGKPHDVTYLDLTNTFSSASSF